MGDPFLIVIILAIAGVVLVLVTGLGGFAKGGAFNFKYSNKLMQYRIIGQFIAILLILLYIWFKREGA